VRILLLNQYYPPDAAATARVAAEVAEALAERHQVTVLAGRASYAPSERHRYSLLRREARGNLVVERVGSTAYPRFRMSGRLANYLTYLFLAVLRALAVRADVVLSMTDPPVLGIAAALVARLKRRPFVYNIRDLYPEMALAGQILRPSPWTRLWEQLHRWALRRTARVIVLGEDMRDRIIAKGIEPACIRIVHSGAPIPSSVAPRNHPVVREIRSGFAFVLIHAGNLGFSGPWESLVAAARLLETDGIGLIFVGDGAQRERVKAAAEGSKGVRILPFRPAGELPCVMAAGDLHIVTVKRGLEGVVVPGKLYGILAAGRPVLAVAPEESDAVRIVRRTGCGVAANPDDPAEIAAVVRELFRDPERLRTMASRAGEVAQEYDLGKQLVIFRQTIEEINPQ